jgi:hypothetical protein
VRQIFRVKNWFRHWHRKQLAKKHKTELREFVYLDEVSVYSLIASRLGPIATEFSKTETDSLQNELSGSLNASMGVAAGELNSRILKTRTHGSHVLRKSIVQTQFKELHELEMESLAVQQVVDDGIIPKISTVDELRSAIMKNSFPHLIISTDVITRGKLMEIEVQLEADSVFQVSAVISSLLGIFEETPDIFDVGLSEDLLKVRMVDQVLENLLGGLVPVRGRALEYQVLEIDGKYWIVHNTILKNLESNNLIEIYPLYIVGVAEQALFWKDIRRILFAKARYSVFCRVACDGIQDTWVPIKLAQVLETVAPDLAMQMNNLGSETFDLISHGVTNIEDGEKRKCMRKALVEYSVLLAEEYKYVYTEQDKSQLNHIVEQYDSYFGSQKERREAFDNVVEFVLALIGRERNPLLFAELRQKALSNVGFDPLDALKPVKTKMVFEDTQIVKEYFIDSEFVAIYW